MATTLTYTTDSTASFTASVAITMVAYGAGGRGSVTGNGGSGGACAVTIKTFTGSLLITVGQATGSDGGDTYIKSGSVIICRAPGGKRDGTIAHQAALLVGSASMTYGGQGSPDFVGYGSYNGAGGGSAGWASGSGADGQSAFTSTRLSGALGGVARGGAGSGGDGAFLNGGPAVNFVEPATVGTAPGGGGGGSYDYGTDTSAAGAVGAVTLTF